MMQRKKRPKNIFHILRFGIQAIYTKLDLVTPRYIKGFGVIISVNRIDVYSSQANLEQFQNKGADSIISFLIEDWKMFGIPHYLQLDNEASFRGSLYHPRTFGKLSRFCLNFGVELVFIPFNEPWRMLISRVSIVVLINALAVGYL